MKYLLLIICIICIAATAGAQNIQHAQLPPVRTSDNVKLHPQAAPTIPILNTGNASTAKSISPAQAVPLRKSDIADAAQPIPAGLKAAGARQGAQASLQQPSSISVTEAQQQLLKQDSARKSIQ